MADSSRITRTATMSNNIFNKKAQLSGMTERQITKLIKERTKGNHAWEVGQDPDLDEGKQRAADKPAQRTPTAKSVQPSKNATNGPSDS